jgi:DnaJ-domain-containing protein 1
VGYFEPIVERKQRAAGFGADGFSSGTDFGGSASYSTGPSSYGYTPTPPPAVARASDPDDPHVILGVPPGATQEQIKAAYREQIKLNHPDKVAHLSPALQAFAAQQTLRLKEAYERLSRRG